MDIHRILISGTLLCLAGSAAAAEPARDRRFYASAELGQAQVNRQASAFYLGPRGNRDSTGWRLRFGYQVSPRFSVEAGYSDFGRYDGSQVVAFPTGAVMQAPGDYRTTVRSMDLSAVLRWPLGEVFYLQGSAGLQRREFRTEIEPGLVNAPDFQARDGDLAAQLGAGFGFTLSEVVDIGVNWTRSHGLRGDIEYVENESDPAMVSVGVRLRF